MVFDSNNQEHYVVAAEDAAGDVHAARYIKYVMTDDGPFCPRVRQEGSRGLQEASTSA